MLVKGKENKRKSLESGKNNNEIIRQGLGMVTHKGNVTDEKGQRRGGALISGKRIEILGWFSSRKQSAML